MRQSLTRQCLVFLFLFLCIGIGTKNVDAGMQVDSKEALRGLSSGGPVRLHFPGVNFRVAVFTYQDPQGTGLGDPLAALVGWHILMNARVSSLALLSYQNLLTPSESEKLSYFDKVEKLTESQEVVMAVWGIVQYTKGGVLVDTYLQIPKESLGNYLHRRMRLPKAMGGNILHAHLRPDRVHLQRLFVSEKNLPNIVKAAERLQHLLKEKSLDAPVVANLKMGEPYFVEEHQAGWARLKTENGNIGWVPTRKHCEDKACETFIEAGEFAGGVLRFMEGKPGVVTATTPSLSTEALAIKEQFDAWQGLTRLSFRKIEEDAFNIAQRWVGLDRWIDLDESTEIDRGRGVPPGGAAFANIIAMAKLRIALARESGEDRIPRKWTYDKLRLDRELVKSITFDLAQASQDDPKNVDVLNNLAILFRYIGDDQRAKLASTLAQKYD